MGLFTMLAGAEPALSIAIPRMDELPKAELMAMEKETTGIYISGHPMDDYRQLLKNTSVVPISALTAEDSRFRDDQIVSIAGIVQTVKMKMTRSNTMMAYVTIEDDTASIELIVFSNALNEHGGYLRENAAVVVVGKLSLREDKEAQIIVNRVRPISDFSDPHVRPILNELVPPKQEPPQSSTLYLRLSAEGCKEYRKVRAIINMFPGNSQVVIFFADTRRRMAGRCLLRNSMISELKNVLGEANVILK